MCGYLNKAPNKKDWPNVSNGVWRYSKQRHGGKADMDDIGGNQMELIFRIAPKTTITMLQPTPTGLKGLHRKDDKRMEGKRMNIK